MQIVLKVWSSNSDHNGRCDFAVVEITPDFVKLALRRIEVLREQKALDAALDEMYFWDSTPEFFSPWVDPATQTEEIMPPRLKLEENLDALQTDRREVVAVPQGLTVPRNQIARVECMQMLVRKEGIAFTAIPKHTDFYVTTAEIPAEVLEQSVTPANG